MAADGSSSTCPGWTAPLGGGRVIDAYLYLLLEKSKVVRSDHRNIVVIDPKGRENAYERRLLRNWRNFLKTKKASQREWRVSCLPHLNHKDSSSFWVLILKVEDYCVSCNMLDHDGNQKVTYMIQCDFCPRSVK
ncbi:unnamed protein product [Menidia menidia]|uniref:(Atlantic silverside) hypothetical protein n=1 Tax=Menidia menidia TaxID=238744 RepID=A0A8S4BN01_9TELE|nr:unnamed protein product [Menidia menidia]